MLRHLSGRPVIAFLCLTWLVGLGSAPSKEPTPLPDWLPIDKEELALKDCPGNPGAPAMILYRQEITDHVAQTWTVYMRIKVFKSDGMKYADVEIPYWQKHYQIAGWKARTIHPDGRIVDFQGEIYDRLVLRAGKTKVLVKTFSLPDVELGSIVEYMYKTNWEGTIPDVFLHPSNYDIKKKSYISRAERWTVNHELYTKRVKFQFLPHPVPRLGKTSQGSVSLRNAQRQSDGSIALTVQDVPPTAMEEFMPPKGAVESTLAFFYLVGNGSDPLAFWQTYANDKSEEMEPFIGKPEWVNKVVEETVSPSDPPETKLRKLYARAQQIRMLAFEHSRSEKERQKQSLKENKNVRDVLERGYAEGNEVNYVFVALCRAAGFPAHILLLEPRDQAYFNTDFPDVYTLTASVVRVQVGSKDYVLDPATLYCPFNLLPWEESGAGGVAVLPVDKNNKSIGAPYYKGASSCIVSTPPAQASDAVTARNAMLRLTPDGELSGSLDIVIQGQDALQLRLAHRDEDEAGRRKALEARVKKWLPAGAVVELTNKPTWENGDLPLHVAFTLKAPGYATALRQRLLLPPLVFAHGNYPFQNLHRTHPVDLKYPYELLDNIEIELPKGYRVEALPPAVKKNTSFGGYQVTYSSDEHKLRIHRSFEFTEYLFALRDYSALHLFYDGVRTGDEQLAVLKAETNPPQK